MNWLKKLLGLYPSPPREPDISDYYTRVGVYIEYEWEGPISDTFKLDGDGYRKAMEEWKIKRAEWEAMMNE
jgi:hypothetical protein